MEPNKKKTLETEIPLLEQGCWVDKVWLLKMKFLSMRLYTAENLANTQHRTLCKVGYCLFRPNRRLMRAH